MGNSNSNNQDVQLQPSLSPAIITRSILIEKPESIFLLDCTGKMHEFSQNDFREFAKDLNVQLTDNFTNNCNLLRKAVLNLRIQQHENEKQKQSKLAIDQFKNKTCQQLLQDYSQREWLNFYRNNREQASLQHLDHNEMENLLTNQNNDPWYLNAACQVIRSNLVKYGEVNPTPMESQLLQNFRDETNKYRGVINRQRQQIAAINQQTQVELSRI
jgi:hypothetical protein